MTTPTLIMNARLLCPASGMDQIGSLMIADGVIKALNPTEADLSGFAGLTIDADGAALAPGLIDMRVKTGEPGAEHRETLESAGRAAAAGGVTSICLMPDTNPVIDDVTHVDFIRQRARATCIVKAYPTGALTKGLEGEALSEIGLMHEAGAVYFTNANRPVVNSQAFRRALSYANGFDALTLHRPTDPYLSTGQMNHSELAGRLGLSGIGSAAEAIMLYRDLVCVRSTGARYMIDQLSGPESLTLIRAAKCEGLRVTANINIHHLVLNEIDVGEYRTFAKIDPPLRTEDVRLLLREAVLDGTIDVIVSAHTPLPAEEKRLPFEEASAGAVGLQSLWPCLIQLAGDDPRALLKFLAACTSKPADLLGLPQGRLKVGAPADLALVDLGYPYKLDADSMLASRSRNTPLDGRLLQGRVLGTWRDGVRVFG